MNGNEAVGRRGASGLTVWKIGGSLLDWAELPDRLAERLEREDAGRGRVLFVVGGGPAADWIRDLDRRHGLGEVRSHRLALRSLDLTARVFEDLVRDRIGARVIEDGGSPGMAREGDRRAILAPRAFLERWDGEASDRLRECWDATTDSIAARIAVRLGAGLLLAKSAPLPAGWDRGRAAEAGLVDAMFPETSRSLARVAYLNLRDPGSAAGYF